MGRTWKTISLSCIPYMLCYGDCHSEIETKWIFSMAKVIISLRWCQLDLKNLDKNLLIMKNWPKNQILNCVANEGFKTNEQYLDVENNLFGKKMKNWLLILIFLSCELDWHWNIKLMLITMKVKQENFLSYLLMYVALFLVYWMDQLVCLKTCFL